MEKPQGNYSGVNGETQAIQKIFETVQEIQKDIQEIQKILKEIDEETISGSEEE